MSNYKFIWYLICIIMYIYTQYARINIFHTAVCQYESQLIYKHTVLQLFLNKVIYYYSFNYKTGFNKK